MSLLTKHEKYLSVNLEDPRRWGVPIRFVSPNGLIDETISGLFSSSSVQVMNSSGIYVNSKATRCTVRRSTILSVLGVVPTDGWSVYGSTGAHYLIQKAQAKPDDRLPLISYNLTVVE